MLSTPSPRIATPLLALALLIPFAPAASADGFGGSMLGPGSTSTRFFSDGGTILVEIGGTGEGATGGGFLLDGPTGAVMFTIARIPNHDGLLVDLRGSADVHVDMSATVDPRGGFARQLSFPDSPPGEYDIIAFGAGAVSVWSWSVLGAGPVLAQQKSNAAWLATSRDFRGESNVQVFEAGAGARATDGRFPFDVRDGLVGVFYPVHVTSVHDSMMARTPAGSRDCTCAWLASGPPGSYVLHESGVGAGASILADVIFIGADTGFA